MSLFKKALAEYPICGINSCLRTAKELYMTHAERLPHHFNAFNTKLECGVNLIEASAGTGKTFSIAMLVLRYVVEQNLPIEQVLVVTFTKAATQELRTRIRMRLQDLKRFITDPDHPANAQQDAAFIEWATQLKEPQRVAEQVVTALASIDNAAIFTIHSFCQRMLRQYALESGQLFDAELSADISHLKASLAEDYWREQLYAADALKMSACTTHYQTPAALLGSIKALHSGIKIYPEGLVLDDILNKIHEDIEALRGFDESVLQPLGKAIEDNGTLFKGGFIEHFAAARDGVSIWLQTPNAPAPVVALKSFTFDALMNDALNGQKFRTTKKATGEERKRSFLAELGIDHTQSLDALLARLGQVELAFRLGLHDYIGRHLQKDQSQQKVLSFDDLITRLSHVLEGEGGDLLQAALRRQFKVALIDEFQDTDQQQWHIFSTVYNTPQHALFLIGDPKQAIYKFRGADIYSYLDAKRTAHHAYTLETNFRSHPKLVNAVNHLFGDAENPFLIQDIPYHLVKAGQSGDKLWWGDESAHSMVLWSLEANESHKEGFWSGGVAKEAIRAQVVNEVVRLLDSQQGAISGDSPDQTAPLQPQDIAILVRGNEEAASYQQSLQAADIPSVLNSKQSVFDSEEAVNLLSLLYALLQPANLQRTRQALSLSWFGLDGQAYDVVCRDDLSMQGFVSAFQAAQLDWQQKGLMVMMRRLMAVHQVLENIGALDQPERRITNLHHLLECLQQAVSDERLDPLKTVQWLNEAVQGGHQGDGQELRLERDDAAVNIVTIHSAKGLEYPVVFCPDLWTKKRTSKAPSGDKVVICHEKDQLIADLGTDKQPERFEQSKFEQLAEDLRLLYVAVTRASQRCYVAWATVAAKPDTAFSHLLAPHTEDDQWDEKLQALSQKSSGFEYQRISAQGDSLIASMDSRTTGDLVALSQQYEIRQRWQMSSYSALAYLSHQTQDYELPTDKSQEPVSIDELTEAVEVVYQLPKGAHTGNVLHDLLEHSSFTQLKDLSPDSAEYEAYEALRERSCLRYGLTLDEVGYEVLDDLLIKSVTAPLDALDADFTLASLDDSACLKEMPFYFTMNHLQTQKLNQLLTDQPSCQALSPRSLSGQLTGFIDLICEYQGRYYVMDYKSNALDQYDHPSMEAAMHAHNYGLQYFLYSVVLHHYLSQRLPDYDYDQHFGGVRYLFLRGMNKAYPMQGVFIDRPSLEIIEGISEVLSGGAV